MQNRSKNLLLAFDAFGTLFYPKDPITQQYARMAQVHGIHCSNTGVDIKDTFKRAFKHECSTNPNYGKATGLGAEKWWGNVITRTFDPFLSKGQKVPKALIRDLLTQFSTRAGYNLYPDVLPFFQLLREKKRNPNKVSTWKWDKTIVGIITNSDSRVPDILASFGLRIGPRRVGTAHQRMRAVDVDDDVSFVVLSYDVGFEKPDARIFDAAVKMGRELLEEDASGVVVGDCEKLYVGDSMEKDYMGARDAGWNAVLLDREAEDDHLKDSVVERYSNERLVERGVKVVGDLRALSQWSAAPATVSGRQSS